MIERVVLRVGVWIILATLALGSPAWSAPVAAGSTLLSQLREGGYVIFFRHASTDHRQEDTTKRDLVDCSSQRNLDAAGREQARVVGEAFSAMKVPVGDVLSSVYCRCRDTATIAFGRATPVDELTSFMGLPPQEQAKRVNTIKAMLATPPPTGVNTVLVSHKYMFQFASNGVVLEEGEAAVYEPLGDEGFRLVARLTPEQWRQLASSEADAVQALDAVSRP